MSDPPERPHGALAETLGRSADWAGLTAALWCEREALEYVTYKLTAERLVLQKAQRFLAKADEDLDRAVARLFDSSADRAELTGVLSAQLSVEATLAAVLVAAPVPWPAVLADHRLALRVLVRDAAHAAAATSRQLRISGRAVIDSLEEVRIDRSGAGMHLALGQFRSVERELLVTAADATHRSAMVIIDRLVAGAIEPLAQFLG